MKRRIAYILALAMLVGALFPQAASAKGANPSRCTPDIDNLSVTAIPVDNGRQSLFESFETALIDDECETFTVSFELPAGISVRDYIIEPLESRYFPYSDACGGYAGYTASFTVPRSSQGPSSWTFTFVMMNKDRRNYRHNARFAKQIKKLCNGITASTSQKDAARKIARRIAKLFSYSKHQSCTSRALKKGKGNCSTYAYAFYYACKYVGIDCEYVKGNAFGGYHAWNKLKIDGKTLWYDITGYDSTGNTKYLGHSTLWSSHVLEDE